MLPQLIATLEGDIDVHDPDAVYPLGRSFLGRMKRRAGKVASSQVRNVAHGVAKVGRATGRVGMQLSRGNVRGAFVDLGRAVTTTVTTPLTMAVGVVDRKASKKLEGVISRNDPTALINRKIFDAVKKAVRPIVAKFAGDLQDGFGDESAVRANLRANRSKILASAAAAGTAAGTAVAGPYCAPVGASLAPAAVDAVIEEIVKKARSLANGTAAAPAADAATTDAPAAAPAADAATTDAPAAATGSKIPTGVKIAAAGVGVYVLSKVLR